MLSLRFFHAQIYSKKDVHCAYNFQAWAISYDRIIINEVLQCWRFKVKDFSSELSKFSGNKRPKEFLEPLTSISFCRHFSNSSFAAGSRTYFPEAVSSKSICSVEVSRFPISAVGSATNAIAFAKRIWDNHSFLSSCEKQDRKNVRFAILPADTDRFTSRKQYFVCLSACSSIYRDMSLKNITSLGASCNDSASVL